MIEEMACPLSRFERHLRQLQLMGVFEHIAGLIVSRPENYDPEKAPFGAEELLMEIMPQGDFPIVTDFDCGHCHPMLTLALGTTLLLEAEPDNVSLTALEPMINIEAKDVIP